MKPNINSVEVHPQLSNNGHPVNGALVGAGSLWHNFEIPFFNSMLIVKNGTKMEENDIVKKKHLKSIEVVSQY